MSGMFENYGLGFVAEEHDEFDGFFGYVLSQGKIVPGYYGLPYVFTPMGDVEFWTRTGMDEDGSLVATAIDAHSCGQCIWDVVHTGIDVSPAEGPKLRRTVMVTRKDGTGGMLPVNLITADVLPSFMKGDEMRVQVIAQPLLIEYYASEEEYEEAQPEDKYGKK